MQTGILLRTATAVSNTMPQCAPSAASALLSGPEISLSGTLIQVRVSPGTDTAVHDLSSVLQGLTVTTVHEMEVTQGEVRKVSASRLGRRGPRRYGWDRGCCQCLAPVKNIEYRGKCGRRLGLSTGGHTLNPVTVISKPNPVGWKPPPSSMSYMSLSSCCNDE